MGFFDKLFGGKSKDENTAKFTNQSKTVLTPLQGKVLAQADIPDETFAQGILGPGCGIEPTGDTVYAPFDGTVTQIATTLHAVGITSKDSPRYQPAVRQRVGGTDSCWHGHRGDEGQWLHLSRQGGHQGQGRHPAAEGGSGRYPRRRSPHRHRYHRDRWRR